MGTLEKFDFNKAIDDVKSELMDYIYSNDSVEDAVLLEALFNLLSSIKREVSDLEDACNQRKAMCIKVYGEKLEIKEKFKELEKEHLVKEIAELSVIVTSLTLMTKELNDENNVANEVNNE